MGKAAIIVESPTKTRTLARFLGDEYVLLASKGHVRDLPENGLAVDLTHDFAPTYEVIERQKKTVSDLKKKIAGAERVYLASDPDREGEAIAWGLAETLGLKNPLRIEFNEITEQAVRDALAHPTEVNFNRVNAQQARRILDRLVGYQISPLLWRKLSGGRRASLSAGRVQSVALRLICDREREVAAFVPDEYWSVEVSLSPSGSADTFTAELKTRAGEELELTREEQVAPIVAELPALPYSVTEVKRKEARRKPQPPFITSTLQRQAANQLDFAARRTMTVAQQLYEGIAVGEGVVGLITYMRTDSTRIADQARQQATGFITAQWGESYLGPGQRGKKAKGAQEAHEAIRPTDVTRTPESVRPYLSEEQARLYELIWRRFVASQMASAVYDQTAVEIAAGEWGLRASGSVLKFAGYQAALPARNGDEEEDRRLPALESGDRLEFQSINAEQHFTKPPARFNEGSLVAALEENGIGRPSTYAPIIETLRQRRYVRMQQRAFMPTPLGFGVCDWLIEHFPRIMDVDFTAHVEGDLDAVEGGELDWVALLRGFYADFEPLLGEAEKAGPAVAEGESCAKCGGSMLVRYSMRGKFAGCERYPECDYTVDLMPVSVQREEPEALDESCPECGGKLVLRTGRGGRRFVGCGSYPKCRYSRPGPDEREQTSRPPAVSTDIPCEKCGKMMMLRHGRRGPFLGCSGYPRCRSTRNATDEELGALTGDQNA